MPGILNVAAYRFVDIHDSPVPRVRPQGSAARARLKRTLRLAPEGIDVDRLDDGILKSFQGTGGQARGWRGRCVVFDDRLASNSELEARAWPTC
jgi:predicted sulfurtransferase